MTSPQTCKVVCDIFGSFKNSWFLSWCKVCWSHGSSLELVLRNSDTRNLSTKLCRTTLKGRVMKSGVLVKAVEMFDYEFYKRLRTGKICFEQHWTMKLYCEQSTMICRVDYAVVERFQLRNIRRQFEAVRASWAEILAPTSHLFKSMQIKGTLSCIAVS